jgi:BarA-like signal transduction histidine kinase
MVIQIMMLMLPSQAPVLPENIKMKEICLCRKISEIRILFLKLQVYLFVGNVIFCDLTWDETIAF